MTFNDKNQHPSVSNKEPGVVFGDGMVFIQFSADACKRFQYLGNNEGLHIGMTTEMASHLHYCLTHGLFDEMTMNQGMPEDHYGDDASSEPF
jgi:hypothetical protein|tara:strand:- start:178 stop:453 length:276 start_codon:yes stop_codon:yes gene_type:complete